MRVKLLTGAARRRAVGAGTSARQRVRRVARRARPCYLALMKAKDRLEAARQEWRKTERARAAQKSPLRRPEFHTDSGISIPDLMIASDVAEPSDAELDKYESDLCFPGQFPYTRSPQPTTSRGHLSLMRQFPVF